MRKKLRVDRRWVNKYCKNCIWLVEGSLCPFLSCPRVFGWSSDRKATERILEGKNDE